MRTESRAAKVLWRAVSTLALASCAHSAAAADTAARTDAAVLLVGPWRTLAGEVAQGSDPELRDGGWRLASPVAPWTAQGYQGYGGAIWYRARVTLDGAVSGDQAVRVGRLRYGSYQLWADGRPIGSHGGVGMPMPVPRERVFRVPAEELADGEVVLALRVARVAWAADRLPPGAPAITGGLELGDPERLSEEAELARVRGLLGDLPLLLLALFLALVGAVSLILFTRSRDRPEYLWFGLTTLIVAVHAVAGSEWAGELVARRQPLLRATAASVHLATVAFIQFLWSFLGQPIGRRLRLYQLSHLVLAALAVVSPQFGWVEASEPWRLLWLLPLPILTAVLVARTWRSRREARTVGLGGAVLLAVVVPGAVGHQMGWEIAAIPGPEWGYAMFALVMVSAMVSRFGRTARAAEEITHSLETRVEERTRELSRSLRRLQDTERELSDSESAIRDLHRLASDPDSPLPAKVDSLLQLGRERFGLELAFFCRLDESGFEVLAARHPDGLAGAGDRLPADEPLARRPLAAEQPLAVERAGEGEWRDPWRPERSLGSCLATRITSGGLPVGTLAFASSLRGRRPFARSKIDLLQMMALWLGGALDREQRARDDSWLGELREQLQTVETTDGAYELLARMVPRLFPSESGGVYRARGPEPMLETFAAWGKLTEVPDAGRFRPEDCWAVRRGREHFAQAGDRGPRCRHLGGADPEATVCVPLMALDEPLGSVHVQSRQDVRSLSAARRRLLVAAAESTAVALVNLRLRETLHEQATRDPLTGLANRRQFDAVFEHECRRAWRSRRPVSFMMLDVDYFKRYNDAYGHQQGDRCLRRVASALDGGLRRTSDFVARYGGEEFAVVVPETDAEDAERLAEKLRAAVRELGIENRSSPEKVVTISVGVVTASRRPELEPAELITAADRALYRAKRAGRDRVAVGSVETRWRVLSFDQPADEAQ